jgi:hypothetical protein
VRWLFQLPHIGVIEGRPNPRLHVISRCVGIHRFISKTWPLKYKLQKEVQKIHLIIWEKYVEVSCMCGTPKPISNLGSPSTQHTRQAPRVWFFDPTIKICAIKPYATNYR